MRVDGGLQSSTDGVAFQRTGVTSVIGKLTEPVGPVKIPCETKELLERAAKEAGLTLNEFMRDLLMLRAHGEEVMTSLHQHRMDVVLGKGGERK